MIVVGITGYYLFFAKPSVAPVAAPEGVTNNDGQPAATTPAQTGLANPASVNCVKTKGGTLEIVDMLEGQQGICHLPDGTTCEEWALMRGTCGSK